MEIKVLEVREGDTQIVITPQAEDVMANCRQRLHEVMMTYGPKSQEFLEMQQSYHEAIASILRLGGRISWDGELSFFGASWIAYGVIFHPTYKDGVRDPLLGSWSVHS